MSDQLDLVEFLNSEGRYERAHQRIHEDLIINSPHFDGPDVSPEDTKRLTGQLLRIYTVMKDGKWRTLAELEALTGDPQASISAQCRNLRKARFGAHNVERQRRSGGTYEYRLAVQS